MYLRTMYFVQIYGSGDWGTGAAKMGKCTGTGTKSLEENLQALKVLSYEKRDNWKVVAFDRSPFKLFRLRF
jgi:hypothetical protein